MLRGIFDSPWQLMVVLLVVVVVFGSKRLPDAARGLGRSMRIFKSEVKQMQEESRPTTAPGTASRSAEPSEPPLAPEPLEGRIVEPQAGRTSDQRHEA